MRLEDLLPELLRYWWIIAAAAVVAGVAAYLPVSDEAEEYRASVTMVAEAEPADYWLDLYVKNSLPRFERLIDNHAFVQQALAAAALDIDVSQALDALSVTNDLSSNTLTVSVVDEAPERAAGIATAIQEEFERLMDDRNDALAPLEGGSSGEIMPRVELTVVESTGPPADPVGSGNRTTVFAATLFGGIIGTASVLALMYRDDTLRSPDDLDRYLARPLLGIVPDAG